MSVISNARITFSAPGYESVTCLINEPGIEVDPESYGGTEVIDRPEAIGIVRVKPPQPMRITVPVMFGKPGGQTSVEAEVTKLELLAGRGRGAGGDTARPDVKLTTRAGFGALVPHNFNGELIPWVIDGLDLPASDAIRRGKQSDGSGGHRIRQAGTVTLVQHTKGVPSRSAAKRRRTTRRHTTHTVRKGETLTSIAFAEYGDTNMWRKIALANGIHDPRHLPVGKKLKLPKV